MDASVRKAKARVGGLARAAQYGPEITAKARRAFIEQFLLEVDPDGVLPLPERMRRAELARRAWYARLGLKSAMAREKKRKAARSG